jgi:hypothetical protein
VIGLVVFGGIVAVSGLAVELLRWTLRPEARRLRVIRKIGGQRWLAQDVHERW